MHHFRLRGLANQFLPSGRSGTAARVIFSHWVAAGSTLILVGARGGSKSAAGDRTI
jgi:hypothetical protein